jgi:L-fucose isomerase-like protein
MNIGDKVANDGGKKVAIYTLTSELHDENAVAAVTREFLNSLHIEYDLRGNDYADYGTHTLDLIYVRTGGTEGIFLRLLPQLQAQSDRPFYLLTSGKSNSLAASMEILSYLRQQGFKGEIIHGNSEYIHKRIGMLSSVAEAKERLQGARLGIIGQPSDWLISSHADKDSVRQRLGIELVDIPMQELLDTIAVTPVKEEVTEQTPADAIRQSLPVAHQIYDALKVLAEQHRLQGFTLRCFDLLTAVRNTGCLALARLNAEGTVAGCEGDVPALLTMTIVKALTGISGFQANPSSIDPETGQMVLAHCTIPLNMVKRYELDTHFESGIGIGIRGYMKEGPVTIVKVSGDLQRSFVAEGELMCNESKADLCRTQLVVRLSNPADAAYFLTNPIGNHHIVVPGHLKSLFEKFLEL